MIITVKKAILHILDSNSGITVFSDAELDVNDPSIMAFLTKHIEKVYEDAALRPAEFNNSSTFKYHLTEYKNGGLEFQKFSLFIAESIYEAMSNSDKTDSSDIIICDCVIGETPVFAVLKCENKIGYTHQVVQQDGQVQNMIINHYAILPSLSQKINECAFVNMDDLSIRYIGKRRHIEGESLDLMADILLDCIFDISSKESINQVHKLAKKVAESNGSDSVEALVKIKKFVTENVSGAEEEFIETEALAQAAFDNSSAMREEFIEKIKDADVPERVEVTDYVTKKINSNIKITTDIGVELSFPAEYYRDSQYIEIINNDDGTLSIQINNIGEISNK